MKKYTAIITSAGSGTRLNLGYNKLLYKINNKTILEYSMQVFIDDKNCGEIIITASKNDYEKIKEIIKQYEKFKKILVVLGGETRQKSVFFGVKESGCEYILVHDGARPNISCNLLQNIVSNLDDYSLVVPYIGIEDTIKKIDEFGDVSIVDRNNFIKIQTPQAASKKEFVKGFNKIEKDSIIITDESSMFEYLKKDIKYIEGEKENFKITYKYNLEIFEKLKR